MRGLLLHKDGVEHVDPVPRREPLHLALVHVLIRGRLLERRRADVECVWLDAELEHKLFANESLSAKVAAQDAARAYVELLALPVDGLRICRVGDVSDADAGIRIRQIGQVGRSAGRAEADGRTWAK